jgi:cation diffusion facilitator CzcD-associated flavoprotein CzcO
LQTKLLAFLFDAPDALEPETPLPQGFQNIGAGTGLFDKVRDGSVEPVRGEIDEIVDDETIAITNGERLEADVIIYATGWEHPVDMLAPELQDLVLDDEFFTLYRHIMPPEVPNMGFVGYASSIGTAMTSALSAHWLSAHFRDQVDLPSTERMYEHIDEVREWTEEYVPGSPNGHLLGVAIVPFYDALLRDMGVSTHQADHLIEEYLGRYHAERFAGLAAQA